MLTLESQIHVPPLANLAIFFNPLDPPPSPLINFLAIKGR